MNSPLSRSLHDFAPSRTTCYVAISAFLASGILLVAQQVSFRLLAPLIGSSLETWSAVIGVFLFGIAAGNVAGGWFADRSPGPGVIRAAWCVSLLTLVLMPLTAQGLMQVDVLSKLPLAAQIFCASFLVCFPAAFCLSVLTPPCVRLLMQSAHDAGRMAGTVFALATVGSLVGNYLTGFVLIPKYDTHALIYGCALVCLPLAWDWCLTLAPVESRVSETSVAPLDTPFHGRWWFAVSLVFLGSFVSGTLESAAFRMIAPLVGFSVFLSTGVVGVILAGMSLGNYLGGRFAAGSRPLVVLRWAIFLAAVFTALVAPVLKTWAANEFIDSLPIIPKVMLWTFLLFFLPSLFLGMLSPLVIRLAVRDLSHSGNETGRLYAWSTLGCVVGIMVTAWCLIELLGVYRLTALCAALMFPLPFIAGEKSLRELAPRWAIGWMIYAAASLAYVSMIGSPYTMETRYFSIKVFDGEHEGRPIKRLALDHLIHSDVDLKDPNWLGYKHEAIQGDFTRYFAARHDSAQLLVIGGGGYTFPRWVEHQPELDRVKIEVVEIDPGVTETAHRHLGLSRETRILSHHFDGRQFVRQAGPGTYNLIVQDAVNDYSVPYHLMTREYNQLIQRALQPDGVYLLTVIDSLTDGVFLRAAVRTMQQDFAEVRLLSPSDDWDNSSRAVYVIAGFPSRDSAEEILGHLKSEFAHVMDSTALRKLIERDGPRGVVLTDRYAPVDSLMAGNYLAK